MHSFLGITGQEIWFPACRPFSTLVFTLKDVRQGPLRAAEGPAPLREKMIEVGPPVADVNVTSGHAGGVT